jgi:hypothetical protein
MKFGQIVAPIALAMLAVFATDAQANGFSQADAERAKASLSNGSLIAEMTDAGGKIFIVRGLDSTEAADGKVRLQVKAEALAIATIDCCGNTSYELVDAGQRKTVTVNLAKSFVTSAEVPGMMVNLGKKLGMKTNASAVAFEISQDVIRAAATRANASSKASAPRRAAPESKVRRAPVRVS